jgi:non-ribosomal peptide synthetase component E (peptide arylation enzyme)
MNIPFNIVSLFFEQAALHPDRIALVEKHTAITFKQLDEEVRIIASMYRQNGIGKGDRVLVLIPISNNLYKHVLALFYIGAIAVFLDAWSDRKRLLQCCEVVDCKALVGPKKFHWLSYLFSITRKIKKDFRLFLPKSTTKYAIVLLKIRIPKIPR